MRASLRLRQEFAMLLLIAAAVLQAGVASAHHSSAVYDMKSKVTVKGTITKVMWVNPHAYFYLDAPNKEGGITTWQFFLDAPNELMRRGWPRDTLKVGDVVTVEAAPGRGVPTRAFAWSAIFPDGRKVLDAYSGVPVRKDN